MRCGMLSLGLWHQWVMLVDCVRLHGLVPVATKHLSAYTSLFSQRRQLVDASIFANSDVIGNVSNIVFGNCLFKISLKSCSEKWLNLVCMNQSD